MLLQLVLLIFVSFEHSYEDQRDKVGIWGRLKIHQQLPPPLDWCGDGHQHAYGLKTLLGPQDHFAPSTNKNVYVRDKRMFALKYSDVIHRIQIFEWVLKYHFCYFINLQQLSNHSPVNLFNVSLKIETQEMQPLFVILILEYSTLYIFFHDPEIMFRFRVYKQFKNKNLFLFKYKNELCIIVN